MEIVQFPFKCTLNRGFFSEIDDLILVKGLDRTMKKKQNIQNEWAFYGKFCRL